jgi:hypothetical protein
MQAEYAASFGSAFPPKAVTHAIDGEFDYARMSEARTLCGRSGPFNVNHNMNSDVEVTCAPCERASRTPADERPKRASRARR